MHSPFWGLSLRRGLGPFCCACQSTVCTVAHSPLRACHFAGALGLSAAFGLLFVITAFAGALGLAAFLFSQELQEFMKLPMALSGGPASTCFGSLVSVRITTLRCSLACFALFVMPASSAAPWRTTMVHC